MVYVYESEDLKCLMSGYPLFRACQTGDVSVVEIYASLNFSGPKIANNDASALYIACCEGHLEIVQILLRSQQFDVNKTNYKGYSPIYAACRKNHVDIVEALLTDPSLNMKNYMWADLNFSRDIMYSLVQHPTFDHSVPFIYTAIDKKDMQLLTIILQRPDVKLSENMLREVTRYESKQSIEMFDALLSYAKLDTDSIMRVLCEMILTNNGRLCKYVYKILRCYPCLTLKHMSSLLSCSDRKYRKMFEVKYMSQLRRQFEMKKKHIIHQYVVESKQKGCDIFSRDFGSRLGAIRKPLNLIERNLNNTLEYITAEDLEQFVNDRLSLTSISIKMEPITPRFRSLDYELVSSYTIALQIKLPHEIFVHLSEYVIGKMNE